MITNNPTSFFAFFVDIIGIVFTFIIRKTLFRPSFKLLL